MCLARPFGTLRGAEAKWEARHLGTSQTRQHEIEWGHYTSHWHCTEDTRWKPAVIQLFSAKFPSSEVQSWQIIWAHHFIQYGRTRKYQGLKEQLEQIKSWVVTWPQTESLGPTDSRLDIWSVCPEECSPTLWCRTLKLSGVCRGTEKKCPFNFIELKVSNVLWYSSKSPKTLKYLVYSCMLSKELLICNDVVVLLLNNSFM